MSRTRKVSHIDSLILAPGNGVQSAHSPNIEIQSNQETPLSYGIRTRPINYGEILSRHDASHQSGTNYRSGAAYRPSATRSSIQKRVKNPSIQSIDRNPLNDNPPVSNVTRRLGRINRILRNNANNINTSVTSSNQTSHDRMLRQHQIQLRNRTIQHHQQTLQAQQRLFRQRQLHNIISLLSENENVLRTREERNSQLNRITAMSDEALSIIERIHSNLERQEDEEIFGIEYVEDENFGIDDEVERIIENGLNINSSENSSDEFDAEDENGNITHVVKKKLRPNVPVTDLKPREISERELEMALECPICLSEFSPGDVVADLICGHVFHKDCIAEWVKKHPTCPVCRASTV